MKSDKKRLSGFYWISFEDQIIVAEYTSDGLGCSPEGPHWHIPQSEACFLDRHIDGLLSGPLAAPQRVWPIQTNPQRAGTPGQHETTESPTNAGQHETKEGQQ